ncbi:hypothetical protein Tco_0747644 [Tanacetum coccineum]|uniref:Uncharacterized protein n=1 Tax=Tanacetum coccineum TaxID=301880 RepID=A0ABQ4YTA4_9ASTR
MVVRLWYSGGGVMVRGVGEVVWQRVWRGGVDGDDDDIDGGGEWVVVMETARGGAWFGGSDRLGEQDTQDVYVVIEDTQDRQTQLFQSVDGLVEDRQFHYETATIDSYPDARFPYRITGVHDDDIDLHMFHMQGLFSASIGKNNMPPRRSSATARADCACWLPAGKGYDDTPFMTVLLLLNSLIKARVSAALANHETLRNNTNGQGDKSHNSDTGIRGTDFQDSTDDEKDSKSIQEYMNDLEEEYQARALLARSKRLFKKGTQRFSSAKATDQTERYKCNEEKASSDDNDVTEVKALMALADEERVSVGKESARKLTKKQSHVKHRNLVQELNTCEEPLLVLKQAKLDLLTMQHVNTEILKENQNLRNELKELTSITETWLNSSNKVNQCISEQIPTQKNKILGSVQLTEDTSSSGPKDPVFVKSSADNLEVSITGSSKPKLSKADDSTMSNHDTGILSLLIDEPSSAPAIGNNGSSASKTTSAPTGKLKNVKMEDDPPLAIVMKELNELKLQISKNKYLT